MNNVTSSCQDCPVKILCRCLQITEKMVVDALASKDIRNLRELRGCTGAGDGCTACHATLEAYVEQFSTVPAA